MTEIICPECKEEISYLRWQGTKTHTGTMSIDKKGNEEYEEDYDLDQTSYKYYCSECDELLFEDDEEAINFLKST